jgi:hypothetical protein
VHEVVATFGTPLPPQARAFFEPRFGHDFSRIRVHADGGAATAAQSVAAEAFTVGLHIVFGRGRYAPGTMEGRQLIGTNSRTRRSRDRPKYLLEEGCASPIPPARTNAPPIAPL